jgi:hypothetical protein
MPIRRIAGCADAFRAFARNDERVDLIDNQSQ